MVALWSLHLPSRSSLVRQKLICWGATSVFVIAIAFHSEAAFAGATDCTASEKESSLTLLDSRPHHYVHYPRKYDINCIGDRGIGKGINFYSMKRERALGEQIAKELNPHLQFINDQELNAYLDNLVQDIATHSDAQVLFTVKVVKDDEINAYSLPGGFLYVNTGLLLDVPNEATLVGVLAHEIAHVAARHGTKIMTKRYIFRIATLPMTIVGGVALTATDVAVPILMFKFSRDSEREADLLGVEYTYAAGYDPQEFVHFFENIDAHLKQKIPLVAKMFSTHPVSKDRIRRAQLAIANLLPSRSEYIVDSSSFEEEKQHLSILLGGPCQRADGRPVLMGPTKHCPDPNESEQRPKLIPPQPKPPYVLEH